MIPPPRKLRISDAGTHGPRHPKHEVPMVVLTGAWLVDWGFRPGRMLDVKTIGKLKKLWAARDVARLASHVMPCLDVRNPKFASPNADRIQGAPKSFCRRPVA